MYLNKHFSEVAESYLFSDIAHKVSAYQAPTRRRTSSAWASAT